QVLGHRLPDPEQVERAPARERIGADRQAAAVDGSVDAQRRAKRRRAAGKQRELAGDAPRRREPRQTALAIPPRHPPPAATWPGRRMIRLRFGVVRLGVYADLVYRSDGETLSTDRAVILFVTGLAQLVGEIVIFGRVDPKPGRAPYALPGEGVRLVPLPHY